ncbi:MAG TPA: FCD domain-containing protein [Acetobacteraceae bacterium]|nr:FCD domain-containing protein [Acetobacteraceae bacterium]
MSLARDPAFALKQALLANLRDAHWHAGEKLPTERQMCTLYNVGRSTVRRVLGEMAALGLVTRTVGSGTYVARDIADTLPHAALPEVGISPAELMEARLIFEPGLVDLAIRNGTAADFAALEKCCRNADVARTLEQFEYWDDAFHRALATATHNGFVGSVFALISKVRDDGEWGLLKQRSAMPERRVEYQREHWAILAALRQRDAGLARAALVDHLVHVRRNMFGY